MTAVDAGGRPMGPRLEDYVVGDLVRHPRGRTITPFDGAVLALLTMNSSDGHFDEHAWGGTVVFGGLTLAFVVGLAMQDTGEDATAELGLADVRFPAPVRHGDTLYALSEVLAVDASGDGDDGVVTFAHWGINERDEVVVSCRRTVRILRRDAAVG
jgi:itaconyl-CoA hydratase